MKSPRRYWELSLLAPDPVCEALVNFLWEQRALGVVEARADGNRTFVRAFFPPSTDTRRLGRAVGDYLGSLAALGYQVQGRPVVSALEDANWSEAWREHFRPIRVGRRLVVLPPWERARAGRARIPIVVDPGRAFGTGHHGSTASCLERLEALTARAPAPYAIDIGTGSGILAIAAVKLGVGRVLAVDEDPDAVAAAGENAVLNGVADRMECRLADGGALRVPAAPLVLANILAAAHRRLARSYRRHVAPGGVLVVGGILDAEADAVAAVLARAGFALGGASHNDGWASLSLQRRRDR